ncbi:MAG: heavy metal-binding domain-containing protein [Candidatus Pacebacteria bacterium]|nr:heavy metal-binding domain-containing protein [Candidatus Paceibacterota bacterium]
MIITTSDNIPGKNIVQTFGLVRGNTARSRNVGRDIMAFAKNITGGEVLEYTKLIAESREQAIDRMTEQAEKMGANAICGTRFSASSVANGVSEVLVYGTAVKID